MNVPSLYKQIVSQPEIAEILTWPYDFEMVQPYSIALESDLITDEEAIIIARDGTGGLFALWGCGQVDHLPVVYISSEGQAGKIAKSFNEFIAILVFCPFWHDLLKFSGNGQLSEMKRVLPLLESEIIEEYPEVENIRDRIISLLSLNLNINPVEKLYEAVISEPKIIVTSTDGEMFEGLFNSFVASNNPRWKNKM